MHFKSNGTLNVFIYNILIVEKIVLVLRSVISLFVLKQCQAVFSLSHISIFGGISVSVNLPTQLATEFYKQTVLIFQRRFKQNDQDDHYFAITIKF